MSQYLGRGATSRGRMTINAGLSTIVSDEPYLKDENDKAAVVQGIINLQGALQSIENLNWTYPNSSTTVQEFVDTVSAQLIPQPNHCPRISEALTRARTHRCLSPTPTAARTTGWAQARWAPTTAA